MVVRASHRSALASNRLRCDLDLEAQRPASAALPEALSGLAIYHDELPVAETHTIKDAEVRQRVPVHLK